MIERTGSLHQAAALRHRRNVLWLLAAAHVAFGAICSPEGVQSGDWRVPGLRDPDSLVFLASGAIWIYPLILLPLWAALGSGRFFPRFASTLILCLAFVGAVAARGLARNFHAPPISGNVLVIVYFSPLTLCFWHIQQFWKVRVAQRDTRWSHQHRLQFRLIHALTSITVTSCLLAMYRLYYPNGFPVDVAITWWREITRIGVRIFSLVLVLLPTICIPWAVLTIRGATKFSIVAAAVLSCSVAYDWGLTSFFGGIRLFSGNEVIWIQMGAGGAGIVSTIVLRSCGYRILHCWITAEHVDEPETSGLCEFRRPLRIQPNFRPRYP